MAPDLSPDFQDLINCLTSHDVDFLIVGAHALAFHGIARYTEDLDVWIDRSESNALKLQAALTEFGIPIANDVALAFLQERRMLRFGMAPTKIEVLNFLDGCEFALAASRAQNESIGGTPVRILGLEDYIATKRASGRPKDLSDLTLLRSAIGPLPGDKV
ncbi:MAG: hypothetical protein ACO1SV_10020 [Fimbriimonas sp.]